MEAFVKGVFRQFSITSKLNNGTATTHRRLIKFRHGPQAQQTNSSPSTLTTTTTSNTQKSAGEAIWDFQIPARWRRPVISEEECAIINNGGPL